MVRFGRGNLRLAVGQLPFESFEPLLALVKLVLPLAEPQAGTTGILIELQPSRVKLRLAAIELGLPPLQVRRQLRGLQAQHFGLVLARVRRSTRGNRRRIDPRVATRFGGAHIACDVRPIDARFV